MQFGRPVLSPQIGALRDIVDILELTISTTITGSPSTTINPDPIETVRAKITPLSGYEINKSLELGHESSHRIQMRFTPNIDTTKKLRHFDTALQKQRVFDIVYALDIQNRHTQWDIMVHEVL